MKLITLPGDVPIRLRPVLPGDVFPLKNMFDSLSRHTRFFRYMHVKPEMTWEEIKRITRIDYQTTMKIVAEVLDFAWVERHGLDIAGFGGYEEIPGNPLVVQAEVSVLVADAWQGCGLGRELFAHILHVAREEGYTRLIGEMLVENRQMKCLMEELGYPVDFECEMGTRVRLFCIHLDDQTPRGDTTTSSSIV